MSSTRAAIIVACHICLNKECALEREGVVCCTYYRCVCDARVDVFANCAISLSSFLFRLLYLHKTRDTHTVAQTSFYTFSFIPFSLCISFSHSSIFIYKSAKRLTNAIKIDRHGKESTNASLGDRSEEPKDTERSVFNSPNRARVSSNSASQQHPHDKYRAHNL